MGIHQGFEHVSEITSCAIQQLGLIICYCSNTPTLLEPKHNLYVARKFKIHICQARCLSRIKAPGVDEASLGINADVFIARRRILWTWHGAILLNRRVSVDKVNRSYCGSCQHAKSPGCLVLEQLWLRHLDRQMIGLVI